MTRTLCFFILTCSWAGAIAQPTFPVNGPHHVVASFYAITNATLFVDPETKIENATLVIKDGIIEQSGNGIAVPAGARVINMKGRTIYPGFIDLYTNYGINFTPEKKQKPGYQQYVSAKAGAYNWNEAIRAEFNAARHFTAGEQKVKIWRECGFGAVVTGLHDGICRGTSSLVLTANGPEHELIIREKTASGFSFNKGSSTQDYPSSLMGSVALIRQTYLDARWNKEDARENNLSLAAFNELLNLPAVFAVDNKLSALRASRIGAEFGVKYIIKGVGDEYQRVDEIKATGLPLIIPVAFPKPYDVEDPFDAALISTADLKHWEMAPANSSILAKNKIEFAFTAHGCENAADFFKNLRKAVAYGLDQKTALSSLTTIPARMLGISKELGSLKKGMRANFIVFSGDLFKEQSQLLENWSGGKRCILVQPKDARLAGKYKVDLPGYPGLHMLATGDADKTVLAFLTTDTIKAGLSGQFNQIQITFKTKKDELIRMNAWAQQVDSSTSPFTIRIISGKAAMPDGSLQPFTATWTEALKEKDPRKDSAAVVPVYGNMLYPFTDYGTATLPTQETVVFKNATVWTNESDGILQETDVAIKGGKITAIGKKLEVSGARVIDAKGMHLTNGIIDEHSHIAISQGVNECTQAVTSEVRIGDVVNSEDINIYRQLAGGVTAAQLLHGSCNPIGGQSALIKLRWGAAPQQMKIAGSDEFIKFALGENVKQSNFGDRAHTRYPQTRMGVEQTVFDAFIRAKEYEKNLKADKKTRHDLELDALVEILRKKRFITCHSYVQSEINMLMHAADSLGFKVNTFTHILEGYKLADKMKTHGANASTFADWWAYKYEVIEAIPYNASLMHSMGVNVAINSDDAEMGRRLNQEAAKAIKYGGMTEEDAWKMVTLNPAKMLHLDDKLGSIKTGKEADLVLWNNNPLSIYAVPQYTFVDGICYYSIDKDKQVRSGIANERQRIIQKLVAARQAGEKTHKHVSTEDENYHCED